MQHIEQSAQNQANTPSFAGPSIIVFTMAILTLMSCWGIFLYLGVGSLLSQDDSQKPTVEQADVGEKPEEKNSQTPAAVVYEDVEHAFVLNLKRSELRNCWEQTNASFAKTRSVASQFNDRFTALLTNDKGRRLAAPETARMMKCLADYSSESDLDLDELQRELRDVEQLIDSELHANVNIDGIIDRLVIARNELETDHQRIEEVSGAVDDLLAQNLAAQQLTLNEAIKQLEVAHASAIQEYVETNVASERSVQATQIQAESVRHASLPKQSRAAVPRSLGFRRFS